MEIYLPAKKMDKGPYVIYRIDYLIKEITLISVNAPSIKYKLHYSDIWVTGTTINILWVRNYLCFKLSLCPRLNQVLNDVVLYDIH